MSNLFYPLFACYILSFCALIFVSYKENLSSYRLGIKSLTSLGFIAIGLVSGMQSQNLGLFLHLLPAFVFCFIGDALLAVTDDSGSKKFFLFGLFAFLTGHILFTTGFDSLAPFKWQELILPMLALPLALFLTKLEHMETGKMRNYVLIYSFFVTLLFSKGLSVYFATQNIFGTMVLCGSISFILSDGIIMFLYFYKKKHPWVRFFNLFTYYLATVLLAFSIYFY